MLGLPLRDNAVHGRGPLRNRGLTINGDLVVIVEHDEAAEAKVARQGAGL